MLSMQYSRAEEFFGPAMYNVYAPLGACLRPSEQ